MNVLLITIDTLRPDHLGCYGCTKAITPNIDRIAGRGIVFHQAITNGTYTKVAFPPIMSSTYAGMYGGPFARVGENRPMLAKTLKEHGYNTAGFISNPLLGANVGYDQGFDVFEEPVHPKEDRRWLKIKGIKPILSLPAANSVLMQLGLNTCPHPVYVNGDVIVKSADHFLEMRPEKFFLWTHFMDAHWPYHLMEDLKDGSDRAQAWSDLRTMWSHKRNNPGGIILQRIINLYDAAIARIDHHIIRLINSLEQNGFAKDTLIVITSDHGEAFYEHGRFSHGPSYDFHEELIHVPLIISPPDVKRRVDVNQLVSLIDLPPTILYIFDIPVPEKMSGQSLTPFWKSNNTQASKPVIIEMIEFAWYCAAVRTENFKYLYNERKPYKRKLFDLQNDPGEKKDLFSKLPELEAELEEILAEHLRQIVATSHRDENGKWQIADLVEERLRALGYLD